jgi:hypothetical protein
MPSIRHACLVFALMLAAGCTPKFDWREMPAANGAVRVTFPAKPKTATNEVDVAGHTLPLSFTVAEVDNSVFAVGYAKLPDAVLNDPAELAKLADAFEGVLQANLGGTIKTRKEIGLKQLPSDNRKLRRGTELEVHGHVGDTPSWLLGRVYVLGNMMIEVVAEGRESELPAEMAQTFVQSVRAD